MKVLSAEGDAHGDRRKIERTEEPTQSLGGGGL